MTRTEYEKKLNSFTKEVLVNYILNRSRFNIESILSEIETIERDMNYQTYKKMSDEALEEIKTSTSSYVEYVYSLKKKYGKESLSLRDLTNSEVEKLSNLHEQMDLAHKKFDKAMKYI